MWDFFVALFGGAYYLDKAAARKSEKKRHQSEVSELKTQISSLEDLHTRNECNLCSDLCDYELEEKFDHMSYTEVEQVVLSSVDIDVDALNYILNNTLYKKCLFTAIFGKLPEEAVFHGIFLKECNRSIAITFASALNELLKKNGVQEKLFFVPCYSDLTEHNSGKLFQDYYSIEDIPNITSLTGYLVSTTQLGKYVFENRMRRAGRLLLRRAQ